MSLLKNYITTLFRSFTRDLFYSLINLFGLAIGLTVAFLIFIYIEDELSYDRYVPGHEHIYRLESHFVIKGKPDEFAITAVPLGPALKDEYPEITEFSRMTQAGKIIFEKNEEKFQEDSVWYADSTLFSLMSVKLLFGNPQSALSEPNTMAVSATLAKKYFGRLNVVGESLKTNDNIIYRITAVFPDLPWNSHVRYNALLSTATLAKRIGDAAFNDRSSGAFWYVEVMTFVRLDPNTNIESVLNKTPEFYDKYMKELGDKIQASFTLKATRLSRVHYHSGNLQWDLPTGNISYLYLLGIVGILILIIAAINYMNLSTARSARRAREVGMRKVSGASRNLLVRQFLGESVLLSIAAMLISVVLIILVLPFFNDLAGKNFTPGILLRPLIAGSILALTIFVGLFSGFYPAFYLSSFKPVKILKGMPQGVLSGAGLRRSLVVFQFFISSGLIIASLVVNGQLRFMQTKDPGFDKDNLIILNLNDSTVRKNLEGFKQELEKNPDIIASSASNGIPGNGLSKLVMRMEGENGELEEHAINLIVADYDYLPALGVKLDTGRFYQRSMSSDVEKAFVINEAAVRELNWQKDPLGKRFQYGINLDGTARQDGEIVGVIKDFNYASLHNPVDPLVIILSSDPVNLYNLAIRIRPGSGKSALEWIRKVRQEFNPYYPFDYYFLSDKLNEQYEAEAKMSRIFMIFTLLILFVSALGLLGLSAFITQQKTKEIGIRKVVGSMPEQIVFRFLGEFMRWVLIANVLAIPVAWYLMNKWLENFHYRIQITLLFFAISIAVSLMVAILTVSWQSWKASKLKPAISLKYE